MSRILFIIPVFVLVTACAANSPTSTITGIQGQVLIGTTCPVVRQDMDCADKPYQAFLTVLSPEGWNITRFQTDLDGRFIISLAPGNYTLHPESPGSMPFALEQTFTVVENQFTRLIVIYDSGIR